MVQDAQNPSGLCMCGCGERTALARQTDRRLGYIKGRPVRYVVGHNTRKPRPPCACGCGAPVVGHAAKWVKGHDKRKPRPEPNPSGLCMCGCGQPAPIASNGQRGDIKGKRRRYIFGHYGKIPEPVVDVTTGCWIWQGASGTNGRGSTGSGRKGKQVLAYRLYYERHVGPIPEGHHLHHTCENPMCVNPAHLEALTPVEHVQRHRAA